MTWTAPEVAMVEQALEDLRELRREQRSCRDQCAGKVAELARAHEICAPKVEAIHEWKAHLTGKMFGGYFVVCCLASLLSLVVGAVWSEFRVARHPVPAPIASMRP